MKKTKFIAGAMVLSLGLLGTGYAYWTDSLQVNTTVSTGTFNLEFEPIGTTTFVKDASGKLDHDTLQVADISMEDSVMKLEVANMYPGSRVEFVYNISNESTIPMILDNLTVEGGDTTGFIVGFKGKDGTKYADSSKTLQAQLEDVLTQAYAEIAVTDYKEESHLNYIIIEMLRDTNTDETTQGKDFTMEISLNWRQENAN